MGKLDHITMEGIFMGYDNFSENFTEFINSGQRIYTKNNEILSGRTVKFLENNIKNLEEETNEPEHLLENKN